MTGVESKDIQKITVLGLLALLIIATSGLTGVSAESQCTTKVLKNGENTVDMLKKSVLIPGAEIRLGMTDLSPGPSARFSISERVGDGSGTVNWWKWWSVTSFKYRDNMYSDPPFQVGVDLELLNAYSVIPQNIDVLNGRVTVQICTI